MRIKTFALCIFSIGLLAACQSNNTSASPTQPPDGWIRPTETARVWATIAPENIATPSPTPTSRPLSLPPLGRIAFQSDRDGGFEIYVMNADGSAISRLTNNSAVDVFPAWSPDGSKIAFTSDRAGNPDIYIVNADGTDLRQLTNNSDNDVLPDWSPDGKQIAFVSDRNGNDEIYVMDVDGKNIKRLTNNSEQDLFPSWSPDGQWIVFSTTRDVDAEIYKMDKNGGNLIRLTNNPAADSNPTWSPDNTRIAFISRRDGFGNLFVMGNDGANPIQLTFYKSTVEVPAWSSDSRMIAFASDMEGTRDIFIIGADGAGLNRLTDTSSDDFYPAWAKDQVFLASSLPEPTAAPGDVCVNANDDTYGFTIENPVRIGYDPRLEGIDEHQCIPWLLGPQGQPLDTELLEEVRIGESKLCKVSITYEGQTKADVMYFDVFTFEQPKAPIGYSCGSPSAYLKAITAARYQ